MTSVQVIEILGRYCAPEMLVPRLNKYEKSNIELKPKLSIDKFQINVDLRTSGFDNEVLSVDACAVW